MQNKIVKMTRATLAMMVIAWLGATPRFGARLLGFDKGKLVSLARDNS